MRKERKPPLGLEKRTARYLILIFLSFSAFRLLSLDVLLFYSGARSLCPHWIIDWRTVEQFSRCLSCGCRRRHRAPIASSDKMIQTSLRSTRQVQILASFAFFSSFGFILAMFTLLTPMVAGMEGWGNGGKAGAWANTWFSFNFAPSLRHSFILRASYHKSSSYTKFKLNLYAETVLYVRDPLSRSSKVEVRRRDVTMWTWRKCEQRTCSNSVPKPASVSR